MQRGRVWSAEHGSQAAAPTSLALPDAGPRESPGSPITQSDRSAKRSPTVVAHNATNFSRLRLYTGHPRADGGASARLRPGVVACSGEMGADVVGFGGAKVGAKVGVEAERMPPVVPGQAGSASGLVSPGEAVVGRRVKMVARPGFLRCDTSGRLTSAAALMAPTSPPTVSVTRTHGARAWAALLESSVLVAGAGGSPGAAVRGAAVSTCRSAALRRLPG